MTFLSTLFGDSKIGGVLAVVVGLLVLALVVFFLFRMFAGRGLSSAPGNRSRQPRLGIVDAFDLDRQRQLVLVRRDNVEHLIMIGGPNDLLIEQAIVRAQPLVGSETRREPAASAPAAPVTNGGQGERTAPRMPTFEPGREPVREPMETGFGEVPPPSRAPMPEPAATPPAPQVVPARQSYGAGAPGEGIAPPPARPLPPPRQIPTLPPRPTPVPPPLRPAPPQQPSQNPLPPLPSRGPAAPPRPVPPPVQPAPVAPPSEPSPPAPPRLSVDINSLEEEMAKLLGRPPAEPGKD